MTFLNEVNPVPQLISVVLYSHTRMHSSRMRTARTLPYGCLPDRDPLPLDRDHPGQRHPPWTETPPGQTHPLDRDGSPRQRLSDKDPLDRDPPG